MNIGSGEEFLRQQEKHNLLKKKMIFYELYLIMWGEKGKIKTFTL